MTEPPRSARVRAGAAAARLAWVAAACAFAILLAVLSWRMAAGQDPSLRRVRPVAAVTAVAVAPPPRVVVRRVVRRIIVTRVLPPRAAPRAATPAYAPPAARAAYVPPQPVATPAPMPAPHAVTRAS